MVVAIDEALAALECNGYFVTSVLIPREEANVFLMGVATSLGGVYVPPDCDPGEPIIRTAPTKDEGAAPFDRPEAIGWHGDFATHEDRPELSLVYITRSDPRGADYGAWRLASVDKVLCALSEAPAGREALRLLRKERVPVSYDERQRPKWFRLIEERPGGSLGLRFYAPSVRRGCLTAYGEVPREVASALAALEEAADKVQEVVRTEAGSLLITNNWLALHDRVHQTVRPEAANREALLCFVQHQEATAS